MRVFAAVLLSVTPQHLAAIWTSGRVGVKRAVIASKTKTKIPIDGVGNRNPAVILGSPERDAAHNELVLQGRNAHQASAPAGEDKPSKPDDSVGR